MSEQFGPYELVRKVAQGGMAEVFLATQRGELGGFSKQVAIKRIFPHLAEEPDLITMFFDEARIAANLSHPNIVQIFDLGEIDDYYYIAMEFVHGRDLRSICERGLQVNDFLSPEIAARVVADAATGLHHAHGRRDPSGQPMNVIHRDISPQNILVSMGGHVKVCDFGIAKAEARLTSTRVGQFKGKFAYMSPEQALGDADELDARSDLFSLGIVLYEITACTRLFRGKTDYETIKLVAESDIARPTQFRPGYPASLEPIVMKALARDPGERYQTGEEFALALEQWLVEQRTIVSAGHISRYMNGLFPELSEAGQAKVAHDRTVQRSVSEKSLVEAQAASAAQGFRAGGLALRPPPGFAAPEPTDPQANEPTVPPRAAASPPDEGADATQQVVLEQTTHDLDIPLSEAERAEYEEMDATGAIVMNAARRQQLLSDAERGEYEDMEATNAVRLTATQREELKKGSFADQPGSDPGSAMPTPTPRDRHHTPMAQHAQARDTLAREAQGARDPNLRVDPRGLQWTPMQGMPAVGRDTGPAQKPAPSPAPAPSLTHTLPEPDPPPAPGTSASASSFEFQIRALRESDSRKKMLYAGVGVAAVFGVLMFGVLIWATSSGEEPAPAPDPTPAIKAPVAPELERANVQIESTPPGARVVVNGVLQKDLKTPAYVSLIKGHDNQVLLFRKGHAPKVVEVRPGAWAGEPVALEATGKKAPTGKWTIKTHPRGATAFVDGVEVGQTPLTVDVLAGATHHVLIERQGNLPYQGLVDIVETQPEQTSVGLDESRAEVEGMIDLAINSVPRGARVYIDGDEVGATPTLRSRSRDKLLEVRVEAPGFESRARLLDTSARGTLALHVEMKKAQKERGTVALKGAPAGAKVYVGNSGYSSASLRRLELDVGEHPVVVQTRDGRRVESTLTVTADAHTSYTMDLSGGSLVLKVSK